MNELISSSMICIQASMIGVCDHDDDDDHSRVNVVVVMTMFMEMVISIKLLFTIICMMCLI